MVIGIIFLHLPPFRPLEQETDFLKAFLTFGIFRTTVPVLTAISGYLVFRSFNPAALGGYYTKKFRNLFVPLLLWNLPFACVVYLLQRFEIGSHEFSANLHPARILPWINAVTGLLGEPVNYPLNFLRDVYALSLLAPVYYLLLRHLPWVGLVLVGIVYFWNLDLDFVLRNNMLITFYVGGLAAVQGWNLRTLDRFAVPACVLLVAWSLVDVALKVQNTEFLRVVSPLLVWPSMSLVEDSIVGSYLLQYSHTSFLCYLMHGPVILVIYMACNALPFHLPYVVYGLTAPIATVLLVIAVHRRIARHMPKTGSVLLGGRTT